MHTFQGASTTRIATMPMVTVIVSAAVICVFIVLLALIRRSWLTKHSERVEVVEGCPLYGQYYFPGEDNRIEDTTEIEDINPDYESTEGV